MTRHCEGQLSILDALAEANRLSVGCEHRVGTVRKEGETWRAFCVCGDEYCAEDWEEGEYVAVLPPGTTVADFPFITRPPT